MIADQTPWHSLDYLTAWTTLALLRLVCAAWLAGAAMAWVAMRGAGRRRE